MGVGTFRLAAEGRFPKPEEAASCYHGAINAATFFH